MTEGQTPGSDPKGSAIMARKTEVAGSVVRSWATSEEGQAFLTKWAVEKDIPVPTVGARGKFGAPILDAFHKANPTKRYAVGHVPPVKITSTRLTESGRKIPVTVKASPVELREFVKANGGGERGVISADMRAAFAARPKA